MVAADGTQSNTDVVFTGINPIVTSVTPSSGRPGDKVTISGSGFGQPGSLTFNGATVPALSWQDNQVAAYVPPGAQTGPVVITQSGVSSNNNVVFTVLASEPTNGVAYGYDSLGRLTSVVDTSTNSSAIYNYDAVGNIVSIQRSSTTSSVSIVSFSPTSGPPSSEVTIVGTNFSGTASQNTVSFNGSAATVFRSTPTTLLVSVPAGATSGAITVTSPGGSATSSSSFTVKAAGPAPVIASFSPNIVNYGMTVTLTGSNFDPVAAHDVITIGNSQVTPTAASATSLTFTVPNGVAATPIQLQTSNGVAASLGDLFVVPAAYNPSTVAYVASVDVSSTTAISIPVSNQVAILIFDGIAGHNFAANVQSPNFTLTALSLYMYGNTSVSGFQCSGAFCAVLPITGAYALVVAPESTAGFATVQMSDSISLAGPIPTDGSSFTASITTPGQSGTFTFSTSPFQHLLWNVTATTLSGSPAPGCNMNIINPNGTLRATASCSATSSQDLGEVNESPYKLTLVPAGIGTGSVTMNLTTLPDVVGTASINGGPVSLTTTTPDQYGYVTFSGNASQQITLKVSSNITTNSASVMLQRISDLSTINSWSVSSGSPLSQSVTLPSTDTYRVQVVPGGSSTGTLTITLTSP